MTEGSGSGRPKNIWIWWIRINTARKKRIKKGIYLGRGSWGKVLAVMWQMGELERNFITMHTSSGDELNIIGDRCIAELNINIIEISGTNWISSGTDASQSWI
jgi:hypothetical protein